MAEETKDLNIILGCGYQDKEDEKVTHNSVTFSKRPTGGDFMRAMEVSDGANPEYLYELMTHSISKFGDISMPVPMTVLLSLNWVDQEQLNAAFFDFLGNTSASVEATIVELGKARLAFGVKRGGKVFHTVEFGKMLNGYDQIAIRRDAESAIEQGVLTIGCEVIKLTTADGDSIEGGLTLEELKGLDWEDLVILKSCEEKWRDSFRR